LSFGSCFNQPCDLPSSVKYLRLNCNNNYLINNLPNGVEELKLGCSFNLELNNLPNGVKKIIFEYYSCYNKDLNSLPNFLEYLELPLGYDKKILNIPSKLKKIKCSQNYKFGEHFTNTDIDIEFIDQYW